MRGHKIVWTDVKHSMNFIFMSMKTSMKEDIENNVCRSGRFYIPADAKMEGL